MYPFRRVILLTMATGFVFLRAKTISKSGTAVPWANGSRHENTDPRSIWRPYRSQRNYLAWFGLILINGTPIVLEFSRTSPGGQSFGILPTLGTTKKKKKTRGKKYPCLIGTVLH